MSSIVDSKRVRGKLRYKVEWKGYKGRARYDWIDAEGNEDLEAIDIFYDKYATKPGGPRENAVTPKRMPSLRQ